MLREGTLDARLLALLWLLIDGGVPLVVAGPATRSRRGDLAEALLSVDPSRRWVVLDADQQAVTAERLAALIRGGVGLAITTDAEDLVAVIDRLTGMALPEDAVRRLGVVVIADETLAGLRCRVVHYLRPTERDAQGHVQRRPPAVLAAWDERADVYEDYAWGITPELADRVDRSQADLEDRQHDRARFLSAVAEAAPADLEAQVADYLLTEPARVPAPNHEPVKPSPFKGGLTDPDPHLH